MHRSTLQRAELDFPNRNDLIVNYLFHDGFRHFPEFVFLGSELRFESSLTDRFLNGSGRKAVRCPRGGYHIFFNHDGSEVIGSRVQAKLGDLLTNGKPGGLNIFDVWQHDPAEGNHSDVLFSCHVIGYSTQAFEERAIILKWPWNKSNEPVGSLGALLLYLSDPYQVFKPFLKGFDMAEHHGCGRG